MQVKTYDIIYISNNDKKIIECSQYSLQYYVDNITKDEGEILCIIPHKPVPKKRQKDINKMQKERYYNSQYSMYYKKYQLSKIKKEEFDEIVRVLKKFKAESKNKAELETKFEAYKKH